SVIPEVERHRFGQFLHEPARAENDRFQPSHAAKPPVRKATRCGHSASGIHPPEAVVRLWASTLHTLNDRDGSKGGHVQRPERLSLAMGSGRTARIRSIVHTTPGARDSVPAQALPNPLST